MAVTSSCENVHGACMGNLDFPLNEQHSQTCVYYSIVMPRRNLDPHFGAERPEWTARKHALLERYMVPAAMKISSADRFNRVHLVDGYAGPNEYGGKITGSTVIMISAALKAIGAGRRVVVHACEHDPEHPNRFISLERNLREHIESGLLRVYNKTHSEAVPEISAAIGNAPAIVFLDPQTAAQMTLDGDIKPWTDRSRTDILGVFMASQACRISTSAQSSNLESAAASAALGPKWREATSESKAVEVFTDQIRSLKKYAGLYLLRKVEPERYAYGVFGLSDSPHGYWLLSNAVAKDAANLKIADEAKKVRDLFTEVELEESGEILLQRLTDLAGPVVEEDPSLSGEELAIKLLENGIAVQELFGRYQGKDFTAAKNRIIGETNRRKRNA